MTEATRSISGDVAIVGGGVAGLEALLALRDLAGDRVAVTLVSRDDAFVDRPRTVAEPFGLGSVARYPLARIAAEHDARFIHASVDAVDAAAHELSCEDGTRVRFDTLILAPGARTRRPSHGAIAFGLEGSGEALKQLMGRLRSGELDSAAFVVLSVDGWLLPLYELALMAAHELARDGVQGAQLRLLTPEERPLALFGDYASESVARLLAQSGVRFAGATRTAVAEGELTVDATGERLAGERTVTLAPLSGPGIAGVPATQPGGFIAVDQHGRVEGLADVYAAGDAVDFAVKQGGLAAQQADAVAAHVAARHGAQIEAPPFRPALRGVLLTGGAPQYLRSDVRGADAEVAGAPYPLWWPPTKIAGRYLSPYLWGRSELQPLRRPEEGFIDIDIPLTSSTWPG